MRHGPPSFPRANGGDHRWGLHIGLRWRIVTLLLLVSLLPLGLVGVGSWVVFGRLLVDKTLEQQRNVVRSHASAIDLHLAERLRALELVAHGQALDQLTAPGGLQRTFDLIAATYPKAFVDLGVIGADGRHLAYVGPYDLRDKNYAHAEWFKTVLSEGAFVSDVFAGYRQVPHCVIAVLHKGNGNPWILRATINSDAFYSLVRPSHVGKTGDAFIVNTAGLYQTPPRLGKVLERSPIVSPEPHHGVRDSRVLGAQGPMVQVTTWLNNNRWMLVVRQDEAEIRAPVHQAAAWGAVVVSIAVGLIVLTTFFATWHLTNRIDRGSRERDDLHRDLMRSGKLASLGEMATGLAHEINNPLAIISAEQTNIADQFEEVDLPAEVRKSLLESVARCKRQVDRCSGITSKMLQFGRKTESRLMPTTIGPMLSEITELLRRQARVRNIDLELLVEPNLPRVIVDATELEQVIANLVNNAMDAITGAGTVAVGARRAGNELQLQVADTGSGIAPEDLDRIFQPFFTTKPVGKGTGMGLAVCYGIVRGWGGSLEAKSKPGEGTTMTIHLPIPLERTINGAPNAGRYHGEGERT